MLTNAFWDQLSDQFLEQERQGSSREERSSVAAEQREQATIRRRQKHLVLLDWEPRRQAAVAADAAGPASPRHARAGLYDAAVALLFLASLAAVVACFAGMN